MSEVDVSPSLALFLYPVSRGMPNIFQNSNVTKILDIKKNEVINCVDRKYSYTTKSTNVQQRRPPPTSIVQLEAQIMGVHFRPSPPSSSSSSAPSISFFRQSSLLKRVLGRRETERETLGQLLTDSSLPRVCLCVPLLLHRTLAPPSKDFPSHTMLSSIIMLTIKKIILPIWHHRREFKSPFRFFKKKKSAQTVIAHVTKHDHDDIGNIKEI